MSNQELAKIVAHLWAILTGAYIGTALAHAIFYIP